MKKKVLIIGFGVEKHGPEVSQLCEHLSKTYGLKAVSFLLKDGDKIAVGEFGHHIFLVKGYPTVAQIVTLVKIYSISAKIVCVSLNHRSICPSILVEVLSLLGAKVCYDMPSLYTFFE